MKTVEVKTSPKRLVAVPEIEYVGDECVLTYDSVSATCVGLKCKECVFFTKNFLPFMRSIE